MAKATPWSICPKCGHEDFGGNTVMNSVDNVLQVPSLLKRIVAEEHGYIVECETCHTWYEENNRVVLTPEESKECNRIWELHRNTN